MKIVLAIVALALAQTAPAPSPRGASVLPNGDFEQPDPAVAGKPAHWDSPDGTAVAWTAAPDAAHGRAIRLDTSLSEQAVVASDARAGLTQWVFPHPQGNAIAETYGLSLYSEPIAVEPGKVYHVSFDYRADRGTAGKLWFRGYGTVDGQSRRLYEGTIDCTGSPAWKTFTGEFHPTRHTPNVTSIKVMLYVYYPAGVAWFDNIRVTTSDDTDADP